MTDDERPGIDPAALRDVNVDLSTITLGELGEAELQSGKPGSVLLGSPALRRTLALFVHLSRSSGRTPRWSDLSSLRLVDVSPLPSQRPASALPSETPST